MERLHLLRSILRWLRAGYPDGIPPHDYSPVLALLHRERLTDDEVALVADELAAHGVVTSAGRSPIHPDEVERTIARLTAEPPDPTDVDRVAQVLRANGWPFDEDAAAAPAAPRDVAPAAG